MIAPTRFPLSPRLAALAVPVALLAVVPACGQRDWEDCPAGLTWCTNACVDLLSDPAHCGICRHACPEDQVCDHGGCACRPGLSRCDFECFDLQSDETRCGSCTRACAAGEVCSGGVCGVACPDGTELCGTDCVDLRTDESNCGTCGNACAAGEECTDGTCGSRCPPGYELCGDACADLLTDSNHCGRCDRMCTFGQYCWDGVCQSRWGSCPYVFLQEGDGWRYHTDLSGSVLAAGLDFPKPQYYGANVYALEGFAPRDGVYRMRLRELVWESSYFDEAVLLVVDAPAGHDVHTEWSLTSQIEREPSRGFSTVRNPRPPIAATDEAGRDVRIEVSAIDDIPLRVEPDGLGRVVLDFGPVARPEHAKLVITAWGHYTDLRQVQRPPYSSGTTIEVPAPDGGWNVRLVTGKAASDARTWVVPIGGLLLPEDPRIRLTMAHQPSVLDVLDAVALDDSEPAEVRVVEVRARLAVLTYGGAAEVQAATLDRPIRALDVRRPPHPDAVLAGRYTRYGDVRPLLDAADDRFVLMAHGDEVMVEFPAPPERPGFVRRVFLRADVFYTLKYHPFGLLTETIEPLPFHGMKRYPYDQADWPYLDDPGYRAYLDTWNTRVVDPTAYLP
jgi:hypothetical protein